jgi:CelD/BcsL family acetyltransferase involved in cellulose biosynthesis
MPSNLPADSLTKVAPDALTFGTITAREEFDVLAGQWDELVRSMPRPSPFLLHNWLQQWWRHNEGAMEPIVHVAHRDGKLIAALPLCVTRRLGFRVLSFQGRSQSALADLLVADGEGPDVGRMLAEQIDRSKHDFANLYGLPERNRLVEALASERLRLVQRSEAPVLDLRQGWDAVYSAKMSSKRRKLNDRKRRQLARLGRLEVSVARSLQELEPALEEAFALHTIRWRGRPDGSQFATERGKRFHRAALRALSKLDVPRIVSLKLDGQPIAFHYYLLLENRMYVHRLAFDPAFGRYSPGVLNTLDALATAAEEGATMVEFLGGAERYKVELADRFEPLYELLGLPRGLHGRAAIAGIEGGVRLRKRLKRSERLHRLYYDGLVPARRALSRAWPGENEPATSDVNRP